MKVHQDRNLLVTRRRHSLPGDFIALRWIFSRWVTNCTNSMFMLQSVCWWQQLVTNISLDPLVVTKVAEHLCRPAVTLPSVFVYVDGNRFAMSPSLSPLIVVLSQSVLWTWSHSAAHWLSLQDLIGSDHRRGLHLQIKHLKLYKFIIMLQFLLVWLQHKRQPRNNFWK